MSTINAAAQHAALSSFSARVMAATNGHHVRWARVGCVAALTRAGHEPASAEQLAASMARFAVGFAAYARAAHAKFNLGAIA